MVKTKLIARTMIPFVIPSDSNRTADVYGGCGGLNENDSHRPKGGVAGVGVGVPFV